VWRPTKADADGAGAVPPVGAVVYSHHSGGNRRVATFLTSHLASHGYLVAALDHSEVVSARLQRRGDETPQEREARVQGWIDNRVPDIGFLLDAVVSADAGAEGLVGIVGYSFGGWTALAAADVDERIGAVVALAPAGSANRRPGIIPVRASFRPGRAVPTLLVGGGEDQSIPVEAVRELFDESPWPTRLLLRSADHMHYVDDIAAAHEAFRQVPAEGDLAWIADMRPIGELCSPAAAQAVVRAATLAHFDDALRGMEAAVAFLDSDLSAALAAHAIDAVVDQTP
jgi:dienelactone hydrolase